MNWLCHVYVIYYLGNKNAGGGGVNLVSSPFPAYFNVLEIGFLFIYFSNLIENTFIAVNEFWLKEKIVIMVVGLIN